MDNLYKRITQQAFESLDNLKEALQTAIALEHATLPPYLYAWFSLKPGKNLRLSAILRSVFLEEMLHLALACNILNSIGGSPVLDRQDFIPIYPGPLPGIDGMIDVPLSPLSKDLVHDIFMAIEKPEDPQSFPVQQFGFTQSTPRTIGLFYQKIGDLLRHLSQTDNIFHGDSTRQVKKGIPEIFGVSDLQSALGAINLIVGQGEGTNMTPLNALEKPAHYYLFESAFKGKELIRTKIEPYFAYAGESILWDEEGILRLATNPILALYSGTNAESANKQFNITYTKLLKSLHHTFNGHPISIFTSIGMMHQLTLEAKTLTNIEISPGIYAGPTFTYTIEN